MTGSGSLVRRSCQVVLHRTLPDAGRAVPRPDALMTEVERMANDPLPVAQRPPRIAALERELDALHRVEEALVAAAIAAVHR